MAAAHIKQVPVDIAPLAPAVGRAASALKRRRQAQKQNLLLLVCACALAAAACLAVREWIGSGALGPVSRGILLGVAALMALTLALSPILAYCLEKERENGNA